MASNIHHPTNNKYLKYKAKYLQLKTQIGGSEPANIHNNVSFKNSNILENYIISDELDKDTKQIAGFLIDININPAYDNPEYFKAALLHYNKVTKKKIYIDAFMHISNDLDVQISNNKLRNKTLTVNKLLEWFSIKYPTIYNAFTMNIERERKNNKNNN
jgi:hypothetical protein